jgi:pyruvate,water dikinase
MTKKFVVWFRDVGIEDVTLVGGKGANLGEMSHLDIPVPSGFIVTANAYFYFLEANKLRYKIKELLYNLDVNDPVRLKQISEQIKNLIIRSPVPKEISKEVIEAYLNLSGIFKEALVAVRSSATAEDLPSASFAGQQETFLNVRGEANVIQAMRKSWASLFEARAIFYRSQNHYDHFKVGIAIPIQRMVQSISSGVMFTVNPVTNDKKTIIIEAILGLGEYIVQGKVNPDSYEIDKDTLEITKKAINEQTVELVKKGQGNKEVKVADKKRLTQKITDSQIIQIAKLGKKLEKHYFFPQDIEWAIETNKIYIVQTRPITTISKEEKEEKKEEDEGKKLPELIHGTPASPGIGVGPVKIVLSPKEINKVKKGDVLVAPMTSPDFVPAMKRVVAIVTNEGGLTSHAAIVSRELGIPAIVGTNNATRVLKEKMIVTVNAKTGSVFQGSITPRSQTIGQNNVSLVVQKFPNTHIKTATKIYVNLAEPELASIIAQRNVDGVGLLRAEFMIAQIGTHPKKLIREKKEQIFIDKMAEGLKIFADAFYPRPVVYRATDFKTDEYRNLIGGREFEPKEPNPLLGYRGCSRYINDPEVFKLELEAVKKVRNKFGFKNLWFMLPFVRTVRELIEVKSIIHAAGLPRSASFKLWMMVEIPSNVILLEKFIKAGIDGISIGSNDLTMLILGTDRNNAEVASTFDEKNEAVLWALEKTIKEALLNKITVSICGQAPSEYPDLTEKIVEWGITSVSVSPDVLEETREIVLLTEERLITKRR